MPPVYLRFCEALLVVVGWRSSLKLIEKGLTDILVRPLFF
jgi:hypothetical protein